MEFLFVGILVAAIFLLIHFKTSSDEKDPDNFYKECLFNISREYNISEYDIFCVAAKYWNKPEYIAVADFDQYVKEGDLPPYLRSFIRTTYEEDGNSDE